MIWTHFCPFTSGNPSLIVWNLSSSFQWKYNPKHRLGKLILKKHFSLCYRMETSESPIHNVMYLKLTYTAFSTLNGPITLWGHRKEERTLRRDKEISCPYLQINNCDIRLNSLIWRSLLFHKEKLPYGRHCGLSIYTTI